MKNYGVRDELITQWYKQLKDRNIDEQIKSYAYRPFDNRFIIYNSGVMQRLRERIMNHFLNFNLGVILQKNTKTEFFTEVFVSQYIADKHLIGHRSFIFPLYLYPDVSKDDILGLSELGERRPNLNPELVKSLAEAYGKEPSPEEILYYIYAILYSNIYRTKYAEFLKIDFPLVPFTRDHNLFIQMVSLGQRLVDLHLLKSPELDQPIAKYQGEGNNEVEKVKYTESRHPELNSSLPHHCHPEFNVGLPHHCHPEFNVGLPHHCHPEFNSGSQEMLNQVKHDTSTLL
ncbi:MAG: hypothetical protein DDT42_00832 [candidate division WS2 bacterium]|uniref:Type ISP restriction-modification enzyme LLaBIII C-terminal specificity domain-containing protein n=1 Tax=Psychracetigena formicireducens TaxID=2986056 RepID=A0A9E2F4G1_PSYF1|nr:hypothetical protein [Candidatus Psychracetigena formicireducens]